MKTRHWLFAGLMLSAVFLLAQGYSSIGGGPIAPALTNCPLSITGAWVLCPVGTGTSYQMYVSYNAGAYQLLVPASSAAGVTSFNGRTGVVVPAANDYAYSQLSGLPTTIGTCTSGTITGTGVITASASGGVTMTLTSATLSGCTF